MADGVLLLKHYVDGEGRVLAVLVQVVNEALQTIKLVAERVKTCGKI